MARSAPSSHMLAMRSCPSSPARHRRARQQGRATSRRAARASVTFRHGAVAARGSSRARARGDGARAGAVQVQARERAARYAQCSLGAAAARALGDFTAYCVGGHAGEPRGAAGRVARGRTTSATRLGVRAARTRRATPMRWSPKAHRAARNRETRLKPTSRVMVGKTCRARARVERRARTTRARTRTTRPLWRKGRAKVAAHNMNPRCADARGDGAPPRSAAVTPWRGPAKSARRRQAVGAMAQLRWRAGPCAARGRGCVYQVRLQRPEAGRCAVGRGGGGVEHQRVDQPTRELALPPLDNRFDGVPDSRGAGAEGGPNHYRLASPTRESTGTTRTCARTSRTSPLRQTECGRTADYYGPRTARRCCCSKTCCGRRRAERGREATTHALMGDRQLFLVNGSRSGARAEDGEVGAFPTNVPNAHAQHQLRCARRIKVVGGEVGNFESEGGWRALVSRPERSG